jgi:hypothetical protein
VESLIDFVNKLFFEDDPSSFLSNIQAREYRIQQQLDLLAKIPAPLLFKFNKPSEGSYLGQFSVIIARPNANKIEIPLKYSEYLNYIDYGKFSTGRVKYLKEYRSSNSTSVLFGGEKWNDILYGNFNLYQWLMQLEKIGGKAILRHFP